MTDEKGFESLIAFVELLPAISLPAGRKSVGSGWFEDGNWWMKFKIDINHHLAWRHVQELGHVLNLLSIQERLPTVFKPVSPAPYMNGGEEYLSWVIESTDPTFTPYQCAKWLEGRLPNPIADPKSWDLNSGDES